jgi:hypothetical protein
MQRVMERNKYCVCKQCGSSFEAVRYNAETCSPKCRKAHSRWLGEVKKYEALALQVLNQLAVFKGTEADELAYDALKRIYKSAGARLDYWS